MTQLTDKIWAVEVPANVNDFKSFVKSVKDEEADTDVGKFKFLFTTKAATEEDARKVVGSSQWFFPEAHTRYVDYAHPYDSDFKQLWGIGFGTANQSLHSLLRSKGLDENKNYAIIEKLK